MLGYFHWPAAEPLADACRTLGFRGTPIVNHCNTVFTTSHRDSSK